MEERDGAEAGVDHVGLGVSSRPHRRQEDDDAEQEREQPQPLATQEAAVVEEALEEDEAGDRGGEAGGVVDLEAEPHREAAEQVVERSAAVERPQQEVEDEQGGQLRLHVVRPLAAVVDVPLGDGEQEGGEQSRAAPEQAPHDQVQQQHRKRSLDDRRRPQTGQVVAEQPQRPGGDGEAERRNAVPPELEDASAVEDTAALEADRGLVPVDEGRNAGQVGQPQRERHPEDRQHEQQLGYAAPSSAAAGGSGSGAPIAAPATTSAIAASQTTSADRSAPLRSTRRIVASEAAKPADEKAGRGHPSATPEPPGLEPWSSVQPARRAGATRSIRRIPPTATSEATPKRIRPLVDSSRRRQQPLGEEGESNASETARPTRSPR